MNQANRRNQHPSIPTILTATALVAGAAGLAGCGDKDNSLDADYPRYNITSAQYKELSNLAREAFAEQWKDFLPKHQTSDGNYRTSDTNGWRDTTKTIFIGTDSVDGATELILREETTNYTLLNKQAIDGKTFADQMVDFRTSKEISLKNSDANTYAEEKFAGVKSGKLVEKFLKDDKTFINVVSASGPVVVGDTVSVDFRPSQDSYEVVFDLTAANIARQGGDVANLLSGVGSPISLAEKLITNEGSVDFGN